MAGVCREVQNKDGDKGQDEKFDFSNVKSLEEALDGSIAKGGANIGGIALPPEVICDYLVREFGQGMCITLPAKGKDSLYGETWEKLAQTLLGQGTGRVVGIAKVTEDENIQTVSGEKREKGKKSASTLAHWVYVSKQGSLMTWGRKDSEAISALKQNGFVKPVVQVVLQQGVSREDGNWYQVSYEPEGA